MLTTHQRTVTINFLRTLERPGGGACDSAGAPPTLAATLSVCKALCALGASPNNPDDVQGYVLGCFDDTTQLFCDEHGQPSVLASAAGLLTLWSIGARADVQRLYQSVTTAMRTHAVRREEHFMLIGVVDECKLTDIDLGPSIAFFRNQELAAGGFGSSTLGTAIAASALLRIGQQLGSTETVLNFLLQSQDVNGGFVDDGTPTLWTTYCAMRVLDLLRVQPNTTKLNEFILRQFDARGGFAANGLQPTASTTYQCLSVLEWSAYPVLQAARDNDLTTLRQWLSQGGNADITDLHGWTPLMAAAVHGNAGAMDLLLTGVGSVKADPTIRLADADALPIFWVGQSGDVECAKALLRVVPEHLFEISSVNGHTILLQAAFFGSERHVQLIEWILGNYAQTLGLTANSEQQRAALVKLMAACNVRGYTGITMAQLWHNTSVEQAFSTYVDATASEKSTYVQWLLKKITTPIPVAEPERSQRVLADGFASTITDAFAVLNSLDTQDSARFTECRDQYLDRVHAMIQEPGFDVNARGGPLQETPIILTVTGVDDRSDVAQFRYQLTDMLLQSGADPDIPELHPMGVDAVIRAAVLNHFSILKLIAKHMRPLAFAAALNEVPAINGQTALHDTVHRALTSKGDSLRRHLEQISWCVEHGARSDIKDHTGVTAELLARNALHDVVFRDQALSVIEALGISEKQPV